MNISIGFGGTGCDCVIGCALTTTRFHIHPRLLSSVLLTPLEVEKRR
jgi:hypothetical protein